MFLHVIAYCRKGPDPFRYIRIRILEAQKLMGPDLAPDTEHFSSLNNSWLAVCLHCIVFFGWMLVVSLVVVVLWLDGGSL